MNRSCSKLLLTMLVAAHASLASAGEGQTTYSVPASNASSALASTTSQSITYTFPYDVVYTPTWGGLGSGHFTNKWGFEVDAPPNYAFTGKMNATLTASYDLSGGVGSAYISLIFDVLLPHCDQCGPYDSDLVGTGREGTLTDYGSEMLYATNSSSNSGLYSRLIVYQIIMGELPAYSGNIHFHSITYTAETVALDSSPSSVPELPPFALLTAGVAMIGRSARIKAGKHLKS